MPTKAGLKVTCLLYPFRRTMWKVSMYTLSASGTCDVTSVDAWCRGGPSQWTDEEQKKIQRMSYGQK